MADGKADATLVAAAYKMGMANVPADTSKTFMRQYEALAGIEVAKINMQQQNIKSVGDLAETGIKAYTQIKTAKRQEKRDDEFDASTGGFIDLVDLVKSTLQEKGKNFSNYKENSQVADQTSIDYQKKKLETIKEELTRLKKSAKGNPENLAKIAQLEKNVIKWRDQTNKNVSDYKVHSELWLNDDVDMNTSFNVFNSKTGVEEFSPQMGLLYNNIMDPTVDLKGAGITPEERNGREGYLFDPKQDRLALEYKMSKASVGGYDTKAGGDGEEIRLAQDRSKLAWISRDELLSMVKKKDKDLPLELNGKMTEILLRMNGDDGKTGQKIDNGDGSFRFDKSKIKYNINAYSDIEARSEAEFYDIIMTPTTTVGKKQVSRDVKGGIAYISNNEITLGNTRINYGEMKQKDFNVDIAVINQMGIGSDIFTAEELKDGKIDAAELEKHLGAKKEIFKVLFNPQTKEETEIAAREIAKFFNLQTKTKANSDRGNISAADGGLTAEQIAASKALALKPEKVFQGSRNPSGIFVNKADQVRIYESVSDKKQEINGADGSFYVLSGDGNSYMQFKGKDENTPEAGRKLYYFLNSKKGARTGKRGLGIDVSFEKMLENNAAYSARLPGIKTQKEIDKENEGLTTPTAKEIQDSIDRGEQSAFNRDPKTGELLSENFTVNDLGEVVEVEGNKTSTKVKSR